jgi:hypothetical protein
MTIIGKREDAADPRLTVIAQADTKVWYKKPNLRNLYLVLVPCGRKLPFFGFFSHLSLGLLI